MVDIPGGTFMMGLQETELGSCDAQSPQNQVTVPAFYAGKYPITQAVIENNPSCFKGEKRPVEQVSWDLAIEFCQKLSEKTGKIYRCHAPPESDTPSDIMSGRLP
ncbi:MULTISPECIES: formylglycine-generating enzyme family protein [unclassified Microcoleus]|uniref:formylglycine-generating enzyme family protein n=1 Tax=unclassified Microcoleus TaxID=2642155 RepID=UPI002FD0DB32